MSSPDRICNCPGTVQSWSGSVTTFSGWLTQAGPCPNDGVAVDWNHYGSTSVYSWYTSEPNSGKQYAWAIAYGTSSPNVSPPKCTNGQVPVVTNPYTTTWVQLPPEADCSQAPGGGQ